MLKKHYYSLFIVFLLFFSVEIPGRAAFVNFGSGARPMGFGGAFTAVADDASALYYNCAGLAGIETIKLHATRISHLGALVNYDFLAGILPVGQIGTFGISTDGIRDKEDIYQERQIKVAYAKSFGEKILVGISFKTLRTAYNIKTESVRENPYFSIYETANFSTDIGLLIIPISGLNVGLAIDNLIPSNASITKNGTDRVPVNVRIGMAYALNSIVSAIQQESLQDILKTAHGSAEVDWRDGKMAIKSGVEIWVNPTIGLRSGYTFYTNQASVFSGGSSLRLSVASIRLQLDYTYQLFSANLADNSNSQIFSLGASF